MNPTNPYSQNSGAAPQTFGPAPTWSWPPPPGPMSNTPPMSSPPMSGPPPTWPPPPPPPDMPPPATYPPPPATYPPPQATQILPHPPPPDAPFRFSPTPQPQPHERQPPTPDTQTAAPTAQPVAVDPALYSMAPPTHTASPRPPSPRRSRSPKNWSITTGKKRKRRVKPKNERKSRKNWADGIREAILLPWVPRYVEAVAQGGWTKGQEVIREVCAEYHAKIPWTLEDWVEPKLPLPEYDPNNPPVLPRLSDEEEARRSAILSERNAAIHRWIHWRARKVPGYRQQYRANRNNPYDRVVLKLTGMCPKGAKKALQPVQQFAKENPHVSSAATSAFEAELSKNGYVKHGDLHLEKKTVNWTMAYIKKTYFDKLPLSERQACGARARAIAAQEKKAWEKAMKEPPRRDAESIQLAWDCLEGFVEPILQGLVKHLDATALLLVGARMPEEEGRPKTKHFAVGTNLNDLPITEWNTKRFQGTLATFRDFTETMWTRKQCAAVAKNAEAAHSTEEEGPGALGRVLFTADEISDGEPSDTEDEDDSDDDNDEEDTPLAATAGRGKGRGQHTQAARRGSKKTAGSSADKNAGAALTNAERGPPPPPPPPPSPPPPPPPPTERESLPPPMLTERESMPPPSHQERESMSPPSAFHQEQDPSTSPRSLGHESADAHREREQARRHGAGMQQQMHDGPAPSQHTRKRPEAPHGADEDVAPLRPLRKRPRPTPTRREGNRSATSITSTPIQPTSTSPTSEQVTATSERALAIPPAAEADPAASWFCDAWRYVAHDYGGDWALLVREFGAWEEAHAFSNVKGTKALPTLSARPKEVATWISHARWNRGNSGEPTPKGPALSQKLLRGWWEWYRRLSPDWRDSRPDGTLEPISVTQEDMGRLECSGMNGILNLLVVLKWVKEGLLGSEGENQQRLEAQWVDAVRDLQNMMHAMVEKKRRLDL
ncbi:hypothetical protein GGG16DRAFT_119691 [Schizophyllum commune]